MLLLNSSLDVRNDWVGRSPFLCPLQGGQGVGVRGLGGNLDLEDYWMRRILTRLLLVGGLQNYRPSRIWCVTICSPALREWKI